MEVAELMELEQAHRKRCEVGAERGHDENCVLAEDLGVQQLDPGHRRDQEEVVGQGVEPRTYF